MRQCPTVRAALAVKFENLQELVVPRRGIFAPGICCFAVPSKRIPRDTASFEMTKGSGGRIKRAVLQVMLVFRTLCVLCGFSLRTLRLKILISAAAGKNKTLNRKVRKEIPQRTQRSPKNSHLFITRVHVPPAVKCATVLDR